MSILCGKLIYSIKELAVTGVIAGADAEDADAEARDVTVTSKAVVT